jgi:cysteine desulfurase/selenocysteine lyase
LRATPDGPYLGVPATCRVSFGLYNTEAEVDVLIEALELCHDLFA